MKRAWRHVGDQPGNERYDCSAGEPGRRSDGRHVGDQPGNERYDRNQRIMSSDQFGPESRRAMKQIGVYEAKTQLPRLLDEVERGETITITRHGRPVARLVPLGGRRRSVQEAIEALEAFRQTHTLGGITIKELIEEGRT